MLTVPITGSTGELNLHTHSHDLNSASKREVPARELEEQYRHQEGNVEPVGKENRLKRNVDRHESLSSELYARIHMYIAVGQIAHEHTYMGLKQLEVGPAILCRVGVGPEAFEQTTKGRFL